MSIEPGYHEQVGGLLLLAAATETGLLTQLEKALPTGTTPAHAPLAGSSAVVRQKLLLTLLFLGVVGLHRTWDLRGYSADGLALLTGRKRAYGYRYTEAFLSRGAPTLMGQNTSLMHWPDGRHTSGIPRRKHASRREL